ncbi:hypothetical protein Aconfl_04510 [Algoriphagus confluentis]|uniref:Uncharacterized protein n=1 Tax=Algoriphagus confluentis TaxID=1697556 RepID=A0ABQ6PIP8_9BACT|nr:hypothetical protein Aconfl_04510 [Algoriphagus confluentis]
MGFRVRSTPILKESLGLKKRGLTQEISQAGSSFQYGEKYLFFLKKGPVKGKKKRDPNWIALIFFFNFLAKFSFQLG